MRLPVSAPNAAKPIGPYSPGIRAGNLLFLSGQVGFDPSTGSLVDGGITAQTEQVMRNIGTLLAAAGASFAHVVRSPVAPEGSVLTISASPNRIASTGTSQITVTARKSNGFPVNPGTTVFLADMDEFAAMNAVYARHVVDPPPARSTVQVAALPRNARVEIDVIAMIE